MDTASHHSLERTFHAPRQLFQNLVDEINATRSNATLLDTVTAMNPQSQIAEGLFQRSSSEILHPKSPESVTQALLLLHDYVKNLPPNSPSPFKTEVFIESCLTHRSELSTQYREDTTADRNQSFTGAGMTAGIEKQYRVHCVVSGQHKLYHLDGSGPFLEGFCTVWTRKFPQGWQELSQSAVCDSEESVDARSTGKKRKLEGVIEDRGFQTEGNESAQTKWQYATAVTVMRRGKEVAIECAVPMKLVNFNGVRYDLEPDWDDVVKALTNEVWRREKAMGWPQQRRVQPSYPGHRVEAPRRPQTPHGTFQPVTQQVAHNGNKYNSHGTSAARHNAEPTYRTFQAVSQGVANSGIEYNTYESAAATDNTAGFLPVLNPSGFGGISPRVAQTRAQMISILYSYSPEHRRSFMKAIIAARAVSSKVQD